MPTVTYEYDDGDDYGIPTLRPLDPSTKRRLLWRRYRLHIQIIILVISLWLILRFVRTPKTDWSRFAYVQYATDGASMCNALMVFESLHRLKSKPNRVLLFPREWNDQEPQTTDRISAMLDAAKRTYGVKLKAVQLLGVDGAEKPGTMNRQSDWRASLTKLRAFELEEYDRVLHLDSDIVLRAHMDELFSLPSTPIAMPRMYWENEGQKLTSVLMLIEPNAAETRNMYERLQQWRNQPGHVTQEKYDMDLLNDRFGSSAMILPHRPYTLLTSEFRKRDHSAYLGTQNGPPTAEKWNADTVFKEAKLIHFSDWPLPKPWVMWPYEGVLEMQPDCGKNINKSCREREIWKWLYDDFRHRRKDLCRILSVPAPADWVKYKNESGYSTPAEVTT